MIDILDKKMLENRFAEDFSSPFFPMLANMYLSEGDIKRARKVCEVGLDHDANNVDGKFVLAQVAMTEERLASAEKLLKQVVDENPAHFNGLRMLIRLEVRLDRSPKTIQKYINRLLKFLPDDTECEEWMKGLQVSENKSSKQQINDSEPEINAADAPTDMDKESDAATTPLYNVDKSMATLTMVQVLKKQKYYDHALAILEALGPDSQDKNKVDQEKEDILRLVSESQQ